MFANRAVTYRPNGGELDCRSELQSLHITGLSEADNVTQTERLGPLDSKDRQDRYEQGHHMYVMRESVACHGLNDPCMSIYSPDPVVHKFRNVEVTLRIQRDPIGIVEAG